jgi:hypothetical protein
MTVRSGNNAGKNPCRGFVRSAKRAKPRRLLLSQDIEEKRTDSIQQRSAIVTGQHACRCGDDVPITDANSSGRGTQAVCYDGVLRTRCAIGPSRHGRLGDSSVLLASFFL